MRGTKETLGGMKEGKKSKSRAAGKLTAGKGMKPAAKTSSHPEIGHGGPSASRKASIRKGGASK